MTKRYDDPIDVMTAPYGEAPPVAFRWRGKVYRIDEPLEAWRETAEMWDAKRARDREYHRVLARPASAVSDGEVDPDGFLRRELAAVFDVYRDHVRGGWRLARVWD
ncbi:MAG: DUF6504 family protein [Actinomycetota bacterium]